MNGIILGLFRFRSRTSSLTANRLRRTTLIGVVLFDAILLLLVVACQGARAVNVRALNATVIANAFCAAAGRRVCAFALAQHFVAVEAFRAVFALQLGALETVEQKRCEKRIFTVMGFVRWPGYECFRVLSSINVSLIIRFKNHD